ncbi:MAG: hypothetical protein ACREH8_07465, partial [Opitutaceae bacterium]
MNKMRFLPWPAGLLVCVFLLAGCAREQASDKEKTGDEAKKIRIGFLVKQPEERWVQLEWKFADQ